MSDTITFLDQEFVTRSADEFPTTRRNNPTVDGLAALEVDTFITIPVEDEADLNRVRNAITSVQKRFGVKFRTSRQDGVINVLRVE